MDAGRVLREARRRAGLSQRQLAERADIAQPAIARIERGSVTPRVDTLDRLLQACGERLYALARFDEGVDRTQIYELRRATADRRVHVLAESARGLYAMRKSARVRGRAAVRDPGPEPALFRDILQTLTAHGVRFILIGGVAGNAHGSPLVTYDVDICFEREQSNFVRLEGALRELGARLRGAHISDDPPDVIDARFLANGDHFTFKTLSGDLDCMMTPTGIERGYEDLAVNAEEMELFGIAVRVAAVADLIRMKRAAGRRKDFDHLARLEALQAEIDDEEQRER